MYILTFILLLNLGLTTPDTVSLNFERKLVQGESEDIAKGVAYYKSPQRLFIEVREPISQITIIDSGTILIYYPVESKAIRMKVEGPIPMPFIQLILPVMKDDYGMTDAGYTLVKHESKDGILYTHWEPPRNLKKQAGKIILGTTDGLLTYAEARDPKGKVIRKSLYKKYIQIAGKNFPLMIHSEIYNGREYSQEVLALSDVKINIPLPDEILDFKLPDSVSIKELEW